MSHAFEVTVTKTIRKKIVVTGAQNQEAAREQATEIARNIAFVSDDSAVYGTLTADMVPLSADNYPMPEGRMVYWNDPDEGASSGWATITRLPARGHDGFDPDAPIELTLAGEQDSIIEARADELFAIPPRKGDWLIYSASEAATRDGYGFWNLQTAQWVDHEQATRFSHTEVNNWPMPMSLNQDRKWICDTLMQTATTDALCDELTEFCRNFDLPLQSADELLASDAVQKSQPCVAVWLKQFIEQWDNACDRERATG